MEATELIYLTMHQERYEDLKQRILLTYGAKYDKEQEQEFSARMDFLTQLQEDTEALLDFQEPRLRYFFERHATGGSGHCCLATVLVSSFNDIRQEDLQQAAQAMEERWRLLSGPGFEISEISYSGLTYCRCPQDQTPPLHEQINRLECAPEFKWKIMTALCSYEVSLRELLSLMEPVLELLQGELGKLEPLLEPVYAYWRTCLEGNSLEELLPRIGPGQGEPHLDRQKITVRFWRTPCNRMFLGENWGVPGEIVAYIGIIVELDDAPDGSQASDQVICSMLRAIGDNSKFSIFEAPAKGANVRPGNWGAAGSPPWHRIPPPEQPLPQRPCVHGEGQRQSLLLYHQPERAPAVTGGFGPGLSGGAGRAPGRGNPGEPQRPRR